MIWRKIKKIYFKIYHLFKLIGIFVLVLIPSIVKAEAYNECWDSYKIGNITGVQAGTSTYTSLLNNGNIIEIAITPGETKYVRYFPTSTPSCISTNNCVQKAFINSNGGNVTGSSNGTISIDSNYIVTITANAEGIVATKLNVNRNNFAPQLMNTEVIVSSNKSDLEQCPTQPSNDVITQFTSVYTDRLSYLGTETMNNEYMLAFIGIIIGFIVLEIFLKLFHIRGGYKK